MVVNGRKRLEVSSIGKNVSNRQRLDPVLLYRIILNGAFRSLVPNHHNTFVQFSVAEYYILLQTFNV